MKLLIPAAGLGTRFLPITAAIPKEMLPIGNRPALELILEEAYKNNIAEIGMIISPAKEMIKNYCTGALFEPFLPIYKKRLEDSQFLLQAMQFSFFYQYQPTGLANALLQAQEYINQDPWFAVALPDDIIEATDLANMLQISQEQQATVIAVQEVALEDVEKYGIVTIKKQINANTFQISSCIEKPKKELAPSCLAIVGRYIFSSKLFSYIPQTPAPLGEILLPDTVNLMIKNQEKVLAYKLSGSRFDIGTPAGWHSYINTRPSF
jgi:UTP--glucose-1-phosphate uridylyltransferase